MPVVGVVHEFRWITRAVDQILAQRSKRYIMSTLVEGVHQDAIEFEEVGGAEVIEHHTTGGGDAEHQEHEKFGHFKILFNSFSRLQATAKTACNSQMFYDKSRSHQSVGSNKCRIEFSSAFLFIGP